jgi:hypothetical protein
VEVVAIVYDDVGNAFAASKTFVDFIDKQSVQHVTFTWPQVFKKAISRVELIPVINPKNQ